MCTDKKTSDFSLRKRNFAKARNWNGNWDLYFFLHFAKCWNKIPLGEVNSVLTISNGDLTSRSISINVGLYSRNNLYSTTWHFTSLTNLYLLMFLKSRKLPNSKLWITLNTSFWAGEGIISALKSKRVFLLSYHRWLKHWIPYWF